MAVAPIVDRQIDAFDDCMETIIRNILLGISLAAPLGPAGIAVIQAGLRRGFLRAFLTGVGVTTADATYLLIVFFGLSSLMDRPAVKVIFLSVGSVVLLYLGYQSITESGSSFNGEETSIANARNPLLVGYLVNISNPIAVVWWVGIFGALMSGSEIDETKVSALIHSSATLIGILLWHSMMALLTYWGKRFLNPKTVKVISIVAGSALIFFGLRFGYFALLAAFGYQDVSLE
jgi:threonine/homoserine/homoserine lactone efflux protein